MPNCQPFQRYLVKSINRKVFLEGANIFGFKNLLMLHLELDVYFLVVDELQKLCHEHMRNNVVSVSESNSMLESLAYALD